MTEEEKKEKRREQQRKYYWTNKEKESERKKKYYKENREQILKQQLNYYKDNKSVRAKYRETNRDIINEKERQRYQTKKETIRENQKQYYNTNNGRAVCLYNAYKNMDLLRGFECTITHEYIETEIFTKSCVYCGESDWMKLGCDRVDNDKGHTPDNVVCSCGECNNDRNRRKMSVDEYKKYKKMG